MNLVELFEMQSRLEENIKDNHNNEESKLSKLLLALMVEVGELANATRTFKFWSVKGSEPKSRVLDEYADVLHFWLSIGIELGFTVEEIETAYRLKNSINLQRQLEGY